MATTANDNRSYRRRAIDFTSNPPNMTTMTCQRNRIVSLAGIVSICRYILLRSGIFFPKTAGRRTASEKDQASITRGYSPAGERNGRRQTRSHGDDRAKARYWFSVIFSGLRHLTAFRHYQEPISMSRLFIPDSRAPRPSHAARICLSKRTTGGCCLDIAQKRWHRTVWNLFHLSILYKISKDRMYSICANVETLCDFFLRTCILRLLNEI